MTADSVAPLLASLAGRVQTKIAHDLHQRVYEAGRRAALFGIAAGLAGLGAGFASYAAFLALASVWTPALAALAVAGGNVVLAGICTAIALHRNTTGRTNAKASRTDADETNESAAITKEIARLVERVHEEAERNGESLVVGSLAAGVALSLLREHR